MTVELDPATGLHSEDCACPRCEAGFRPTDRERSYALWVAARARCLAEAPRETAKQRRDREAREKRLAADAARAARERAALREIRRASERDLEEMRAEWLDEHPDSQLFRRRKP